MPISAARAFVGVVLALVAATLGARADDAAAAPPRDCRSRVLVLSAMPVELSPLLSSTRVSRTVTVDGRDFFVGRLKGRDVVLAMTRIGPVNATATTRLALRTFRCGSRSLIGAIVFSGVAGGDWIGDVVVPARWTLDDGRTWSRTDRGMLATASGLVRAHSPLAQQTPVGDPLCTCVVDPSTVSTVAVEHAPAVRVGGDGHTTDPFGGRAIPCVPGGSDVFGCDPCPAAAHQVRDVAGFPTGILPFADPGFLAGYLKPTSGSGARYAVEDEETAAVARVAAVAHLPFIGFRGVSDGGGDPLGLPGFPVQFFYYRQLASDNAAVVTMDFLRTWRG